MELVDVEEIFVETYMLSFGSTLISKESVLEAIPNGVFSNSVILKTTLVEGLTAVVKEVVRVSVLENDPGSPSTCSHSIVLPSSEPVKVAIRLNVNCVPERMFLSDPADNNPDMVGGSASTNKPFLPTYEELVDFTRTFPDTELGDPEGTKGTSFPAK